MKKSLLYLFGSMVFVSGSLGAQTYLNEDFEIGSMPAGWASNPASPAANAWSVPGVNSQYFTPPAHTVFAAMNDDANQTASNPGQALVSPVVNLSAASSVYLAYDAFYLGQAGETASVQYSTDGGSTWSSLGNVTANTSAWATYYVNATSQLAGQANVKIEFLYGDGGQWNYGLAVDNVKLFTPVGSAASLVTLNPSPTAPTAFGLVSTNVSFTGTVMNLGSSPITSIALKYNDGTNTYTDNVTAINVPAFGTYNFTHNVPYSIPALGPHPITFWIELAGDADHTDDTASTVITGASFIPTHHVTVEEGTGTWCGWCVRGIVYMDSLYAVHSSDADLIAVHNSTSDPMRDATYDQGVSSLVGGFPSVLVDREILDDPSNLFPQYNAHIGDFGFADITPTITFNSMTRVATVQVSAHFAVDLAGDYRFACVFTEDQVHGTASGYAQHNYYAGGSYGPMVNPETGWDFATQPSTIPASSMYFNFVARTIVGGFNGQTGSLPGVIPGNSTQTYTFNYTIPAAYNVANMRAYVLLIDNESSTIRIMNSAGGAVPLGITENASLNGVNVYPNPANEAATVEVDLLNNDNISVEVYDMTGNLVSSSNEGQMSAGKHNIDVNTSSFANGMYFVKVISSNSVVTTKVSVSH